MTHDLKTASPKQETWPAPNVPTPASVQPQKSNKNVRVIAGFVLAALCLGSLACIAIFGTILFKVATEMAPVESVLDAFMQDMETKDVESAYALFSPRVQRQMPVDDIQTMIDGNNFVLFDGYQSLSVEYLTLTAAVNTNPDTPQGTVAEANGFVEYSGGFTGNFSATLEKVDGKWMIYRIDIIVPPDKFRP